MSARVLVAGVGNIFFGDDGFGSEVARALGGEPVDGVKIEDFGIAGMHLGFELAGGYERAIIVDLAARGGVPGTLYVIEPDIRAPGPPPDAHRMDLQNVFAFVRSLGGDAPPIEIVGCEPACLDEGIGLSAAVAAAVDPAVALAFGAAFAAERQFAALGKDLKRYDAMRAMSGDEPFFREVLKTATTMISEFGATRQDEARDLFASLTSDIVRYAKMRSM